MATESQRAKRWRAWSPILVHAVTVQAFIFAFRPTVSYSAMETGVPPALLGLLSASYAFAPLLLALPAGILADRFGVRPVLLAGSAALTSAGVVLLLSPRHVGWLIGGLVLAGVGHLLSMTGEQTAVATMSNAASDSRFGTYTFASSLGQALGPLLLTIGTGSAILIATLALSGVVLVTSFLISSQPACANEAGGSGVSTLLRDRQIRRAIVVSGIVMAAVDITLVYLPALGREAGISAALVGLVLTTRAVASMGVRMATGPVVRRFGRRAALLTGMLASAVAFATAANWHQPAVWLVAAAVLGAGLGMAQPITMSAVADAAPVHRRGTAMTLRLMSNRLSVVVLPGSLGAIAAGTGAAGVLVGTAALLGVGAALWVRR